MLIMVHMSLEEVYRRIFVGWSDEGHVKDLMVEDLYRTTNYAFMD